MDDGPDNGYGEDRAMAEAMAEAGADISPASIQFHSTGTPAEQVGGVWAMLMAQMTRDGANRADILGVAIATSGVILKTTGEALWPGWENVPAGEEPVAELSITAMAALADAAEALIP